MMGTCASSLWQHTCSTLCCKYGRARKRPHRAEQCTLRRLIVQAGGYADMERHVPELHDWVRNNDDAVLVMRCAILDVVSWFPGCLAAALDRRQRAMPACRTVQQKCVETRSG